MFWPEIHLAPLTPADHGVYHFIRTSRPSSPSFVVYRQRNSLLPRKSSTTCKPWAFAKRPLALGRPPNTSVSRKTVTFTPVETTDISTWWRSLVITLFPTSPMSRPIYISLLRLDLLKGYYQVPMNPADIPKTAITKPLKTYASNYSCFRFRNAGATFQCMMDDVLGDLPFCIVYVDDILIFSSTPEEHNRHLHQVLSHLRFAGLVIQQGKCVFGTKEVEFLGHHFSSKGILPLQEKVNAVKCLPTPTTVKALQEFVGMVNYYHWFLPSIASTKAPLYAVLTGKPKTLTWGPTQVIPFDVTKKRLSPAVYLKFPVPGLPLVLSTDASNIAIAAVLEQVLHGARQPLAFFSRKLSPTETRYSTFDRELLTVHAAVRHFRHLLKRASFTIQTDHLPLVQAFMKQTDPHSARQQWHLSAISKFSCTLQHVPGKKNHAFERTQYHPSVSNFTTNAHIHVDIVRLLPPSEGNRHIFTIIDHSTHWPEAVPMQNAKSPSCAAAFLWISKFGIPEHIM